MSGLDEAADARTRLEDGPYRSAVPGPLVAEPKSRQHVQVRRVRTAIVDADLDEEVFGGFLGVLDKHVEIAVAAEDASKGWPTDPDRVFITSGTSEAIELALTALVDQEGEVLVPMPTYPLYTAVIAKIGARALYYRTDPARGWTPDLDHLSGLVTSRTRALVIIDPNNPTGATYSTEVRRSVLLL